MFGAVPGMRITTADGRVVHAEMDVAGLTMSLTQSDVGHPDPIALGGSPVPLDPGELQRRTRAAS